jgi:hypothetical protein
MFCGHARLSWMFGKSVIGRFKNSLVESDKFGLVQQLMAKLDTPVIDEALSAARYVWLRRNGAVFGRDFTDPAKPTGQARDALCNFSEAHSTKYFGSLGPLPSDPKWLKPLPGWVKLNWDAAVSSSSKTMGVGVVVRNEVGDFLAVLAASKVGNFLHDPQT